jgi:hypothetical protein
MPNVIKLKIQQWAGHVQCTDEKRIPQRILESNIIGKKPVGKLRER